MIGESGARQRKSVDDTSLGARVSDRNKIETEQRHERGNYSVEQLPVVHVARRT